MLNEGKSATSNRESDEKTNLLSDVKNKRGFPNRVQKVAENKNKEPDLISFAEVETTPAVVLESRSREAATSCVIRTDERKIAMPSSQFRKRTHVNVASRGRKSSNPGRSASNGCCAVDQISEELNTKCNIKPKWRSSTKKYIDSHCHLDFLYTKLGSRDREGIKDWILKFPEAFPNNFHGCIPNFVHPSLFVSPVGESEDFDIEWIYTQVEHEKVLGASYGIHPHYCDGYDDRMKDAICNMFNTKDKSKAIAVGECGYDLFRSETSVEQQRIAFESQLHIAVEFGVPVIIHCRSSKGTTDAEQLCLASMLKILPRFHHIHRHCFTESYETAAIWLDNFPNTHFGFTCVLEKPHMDLSAVRRLPLRHILLETDAPYFKPSAFNFKVPRYTSLPGMAIAVVDVIAKERNVSVDEVIEATYLNTLHVYDLNKYEKKSA